MLNVRGVEFHHCSYEDWSEVQDMLIYCDPPYKGTSSHYSSKFDHDNFWKWCEKMSKTNRVFVSEMAGAPPEGFKPVWSIERSFLGNFVTGTVPPKKTECLFVHKSAEAWL